MFGFLNFGKKPDDKKKSKAGKVVYGSTKNSAEFSKRDFKMFSEEGYRKNVIAFQGIDKTAKAVAAIPWVIKDKNGEEIERHPIMPILNRPNPLQSRNEFIQDAIGFFRITGNTYLERTRTAKQLLEMYVLRADRMSVIPGPQSLPLRYQYTIGMEDPVKFDVDQRNGQCDIRHIKTFNPANDWYGMSPLEAGAFGVDIHNESNAHNMGLLQNGGNPTGIFEMPVDSELSTEEYNRLQLAIDNNLTGSSNRGRPLIGEGGIKWNSISFSPQAMDIINQKYSSARDICLALSVPPLLLNIPGDSTYSNYKEARLAFYEETVIPLAQHLVDELNVWLEPFLMGALIELDMEECPPIIERRAQLWQMANESTDLTINERREMKGYEPIDNGDDVYIPAGNLPLGFDLSGGDESATPEEDGANAYGEEEPEEEPEDDVEK